MAHPVPDARPSLQRCAYSDNTDNRGDCTLWEGLAMVPGYSRCIKERRGCTWYEFQPHTIFTTPTPSLYIFISYTFVFTYCFAQVVHLYAVIIYHKLRSFVRSVYTSSPPQHGRRQRQWREAEWHIPLQAQRSRCHHFCRPLRHKHNSPHRAND
jgi:hypothetical protein